MKKILLFLFFVLITSLPSQAVDYDELYQNAQPFPSKLYNGIDPYEDEDALKYAWSPYPLFRTAADLYFKEFKIEPGYYILTPRKLQGKDYVLFKQNGKVQFIIPVAKKEATPFNFYDANIPKVKLTKMQKFGVAVRNKFYQTARDSMKVPPPKSLVEVETDVTYLVVVLYYGEDKYTILFRRTPY